MAADNGNRHDREKDTIPTLLLKTRSTPNDSYQEYFEAARPQSRNCQPVFVPVLEHQLHTPNLESFKQLLDRKLALENELSETSYGGLVFTSQRAVEAFAKILEERLLRGQLPWPYLADIPIYTVGPATTRALQAIRTNQPLQIFGEDTGNGEALAHFILDHYAEWYRAHSKSRPLLFLVGEQRRDIIPKTLMDSALPEPRRIRVDELVIYGTGIMESFPQDFARELEQTEGYDVRWIVVFSPTGCEAMLRALHLLDENTGKIKTGERGGGCGIRKGKRRTYIATIGPTTRDYLRKTFGFEPDVCASKPSPEGIGEVISMFMRDLDAT